MTNANIKTTWQGSVFLFIGFLIIVLNSKDLGPSVSYKEEATNGIAQHIYNYFISKLYKECFMKKDIAE